MENKDFGEHPLDSLLDAESEADFGVPHIRDKFDHGASVSRSGNLSQWTAQDFAGIYIRFKPHLERHAQRYLSNPLQAEEIVQDAFLYLMTSLPELDNELGVLKFLKWKIRMLALDVLRSSSSRREISVPENFEASHPDDEVSLELERAEDNAVISLALARLAPRQREAIIASIYEEKSTEEIAGQLRLTENAARQLLFRARTAFKKALIGEAEVSGKSISQVLSIAARKAAREAKDNALRTGVVIAAMALALGIGSSSLVSQETVVANPQETVVANPQDLRVLRGTGLENTTQVEPKPPITDDTGKIASLDAEAPLPSGVEQNSAGISSAEILTNQLQDSDPDDLDLQATEVPGPGIDSLGGILNTESESAGIYAESYASLFGDIFTGTSIEVFAGTGVSAFLDYNPVTREITQVLYQMRVDGQTYLAVAKNDSTEKLSNGEKTKIIIFSDEFYLVDERENVFSDNALSDSKATVTLDIDNEGRPFAASLRFNS
jgi:RNA polymerase sigma factor (sigma-70 family)